MTTAIKDYLRLEASAVWRPAPDAQRRDVVVKLGTASLIICDFQDRPLSHWSLPAVRRLNPGMSPACFAPVGSEDEQLEFDDDAEDMTAAISRLSHALDRSKRGRLRRVAALSLTALVILAAVIWVPGLARSKALDVTSPEQRTEAGAAMLAQLTNSAGAVCTTSRGERALMELASRVAPNSPPRLVVLPELGRTTLALPGNVLALDRRLVEDHDAADYAAGEIIAALLSAETTPPFEQLMKTASLPALLGFLTSGQISEGALASYVNSQLKAEAALPDDTAWIEAMRMRKLSMQGYVVARGRLGQSVSNTIIQAAASEGETQPVLGDQSWLGLQRICE